jgi:hypothetical protein
MTSWRRTLLLVYILGAIPAAYAQDIADAAQSPQTLAEFIDGMRNSIGRRFARR